MIVVRSACLALTAALFVPEPLAPGQEPRDWGPEQALGAPDTPGAGDLETAWAARTEDDADEWLALEFAEAVVPTGVRVFETFNPGALVAVTATDADGIEHELWRGRDPVSSARAAGVALVPLVTDVVTRRVTLHLASRAVAGWNEIDAVGLHGPGGGLQWAQGAVASSCYADGEPRGRLDEATEGALAVAPGALDALHRTSAEDAFELFLETRALGARPELLRKLAERIVDEQRTSDAVLPSRTWLVVLESPWQTKLSEPEYSFGAMLAAIFGNASGVGVRHRYFTDETSFHRSCEEAGRLPGDVILAVAAHGDTDGIQARDGTIAPEGIAAALEQVPNLRLVHFSSCTIMSGRTPELVNEILLEAGCTRFEGVSGYARPVDWMGSALCEFTYFELLLARGLSAADAARVLPTLFPLAGGKAPPSSPIPSLAFRFAAPAER